jgi:transposase
MCKDNQKFTIKQFREQYPDENACLNKVFELSFPGLTCCPKCSKEVTFRRIPTRMCYQCPKCYYQLFPMAGTIFERSTTPLTHWFYAMFLFCVSKNGISAMELMRQIGVTYKCAWRMLRQIRKLIQTDTDLMEGIVEADETFVGGKNKNRHYDKKVEQSQGRSFKDKTPVMGILSGGKVRAFVVKNTKTSSLRPLIHGNVKFGSLLVTDEWMGYNGLTGSYDHRVVDHRRGQYVDKDGNTSNRIENFWSVLKRTLKGSYIQVSRKYLQLYVNECVFRYNNRQNPAIFHQLLSFV